MCLAFVWAVSFSPPPAAPAAEVQLRWQLPPGTGLDLQLTQTSITETTIRDRVATLAIDTGLDVRWHVDRVDADGPLHLTQTFTRLGLKSVSPDGKTIAYDSSTDHHATAETKAIADAVRTLLKLRISLSLSSRGEILDVQRPAETESLLGELPALDGWKSLLTRDGMRRTLQQALGTMPAGPVDGGTRWTRVREMDSPLGRIAATDTYTYEGPNPDGERRLERIHVATEVKLTNAAASPAPAGKLPQQQLVGVYLFDVSAGFLAESRLKQTLLTEVPYADGKIQVKTISTLATKLTRSPPEQTPTRPVP